MDVYLLAILAVAGLFLAAFVVSYARGPARVRNGFFFNGFLVFLGVSYIYWALATQNSLLSFPVYLLGALAALTLLFGVYVLIGLLLLNARLMRKRERRSLANSLTLLLALLLIALAVLPVLVPNMPLWLAAPYFGLLSVLGYHFVYVLNFLSASLWCNLARPRLRQDYIVVLGSGLIGGKVTPLLAGRINRAIKFYNKQKKKGKKPPPKLVLSGGRGKDEPVSEAQAMKSYALLRGIPQQDILLEEQARNTWENMDYSKKIMDAHSGGQAYRALYATSNYHLLRAGVLGRRAGLRLWGIGGRTAWYYLPNALLREYLALLNLYRRRNLIMAILLFLAGMGLVLFPALLAWLRPGAVGGG